MASLLDYDFKTPLPHPGEILRAAFMAPLGLASGHLARAVGVDIAAIEDLVRETAPITPNIALRFERAIGGSAEYWMNLQAQHDLSREVIENREQLAAIERVNAA
jgi:addiction module HigA family antidote